MNLYEPTWRRVPGRRAPWLLKGLLAIAALAPGVAAACGTAPAPVMVPQATTDGKIVVAARSSATTGALSKWIRHYPVVRYFDCAGSPRPLFIVKGLETNIMGTHHEYGQTYSIYRTSVEGVGIIFGVSLPDYASAGASPVWRAVLGGVENEAVPERSGWESTHGFSLFARLVRTGKISARGEVRVDPVEAGTARTTWNGTAYPHGAPFGTQGFTVNFRDNRICEVRTRTVGLPITELSEFPASRGPASRTHPFNIDFHCEGGVGEVRYEFTPVGESPKEDLNNGIWGLDNPDDDGTAKGVGMQLLDASGSPIPFTSERVLGTPSGEGPWSRPFAVRYYRLGAETPTPGRANASVQMLLLYP